MITFIITTYNLEDWLLQRCLESIVTQGLGRDEYEILVVDDESRVSPKHVVDGFAHRANITLYVQKHARQGAARNLALQHARGEWIQFVDGDDYLFVHSVAPCLKVAQANGLDLLMFGFGEVGDEEPHDVTRKETDLSEEPLVISTGNEYMRHHNLFGACWPMMFRRELLQEAEGREVLRFAENIYIEDEEFVTMLVWRARRMARVARVVYAYYQRQGSTVHSHTREHIDELFLNYAVVMRRLVAFAHEREGADTDGLWRKVHTLAIDLLRRALRQEDWEARWAQVADELRTLGLYPIADRRYSMKYTMFRCLSRCGVGRKLLRIYEKRIER